MKYKRYSLVVLSLFLILFLFIASASAAGANETDELAADDSTSMVIKKLASDSSSVYNKSDDSNDFRNDGDDLLSADSSENNEIYKHDGSSEVLKADNTWYVDANAASGGDGSQESPFNSLKAVLAGSSAGDVIRIAPGTYAGENNTGLTIGKILTFEKYGDGEVIFDGQANNNIWTVSASSINIYGLTFKNGKATGNGGAIYVNIGISNSVINATFINNTANEGGAVYVYGTVSNSILNSTFIDNSAGSNGGAVFIFAGDNVNVYGEFRNNVAKADGGAVNFKIKTINSNINATFIANTAGDDGGAVSFSYDAENVSVYGEFRNNVAKYGGATYFYNKITNLNINASFIDNSASIASDRSGIGGAVYISNEVSNLTINSIFIHNTAKDRGGAIGVGTASNSNINAKFINNTAGNGGANYFGTANNVNITGEFINNKATRSGNTNGGSANYFNKAVTNVHISGNFISNTIKGSSLTHNEATNYFKETATNVDISGKFINNTGQRLIYIAKVTSGGNVIHDSIFLNNQVSTVINSIGGVTARNNWFGNNASNYDKTPSNVGINLASWLFLNATANPGEIILDENSTITFKLQSYDGSNVGDYGASKMNITLDLSQTLGQLDKNASSIGEEITYTVKKDGNAGVTAKYETASYTISLTNLKIPATIDVANSTVDLKVNNETDIGATLTPADAGNLTYLSSNSSVAVVENGKIKALAEGSTNITVSYEGNDRYEACQTNIEVTVTLNDASVSVNNATLDLVAGNTSDIVAVTNPLGLNVTYVEDNSGVVSVDEKGKLTALKGGNATVIVKVGGDGVYALNSTEVKVTVSKVSTEISVENSTIDLKVNGEIDSLATLTPADAGNLTYASSNSSVVRVENGKIKAVGEGSAVITVSFAGDEKYAASENKTIEVTVTLNDAQVSVNNATLNLAVDDTFDIVAVTSPEGLNVTFVADDSGVVSVDEKGRVTALKGGNATITVIVGGDGVYAVNTTEIKVTVSKTSAVISAPDSVDINIGDKVNLNATLNSGSVAQMNFTSGNESIVTVNDIGELTAVSIGSANITVSFAGDDRYYAAEDKIITVTVKKIHPVISAADSVALKINDTVELNATLNYPDDVRLNFTSSNENVVRVNDAGEITAVGAGSAYITVSFAGNEKYTAAENKIIIVTVSKIPTTIEIFDSHVDMYIDGEHMSDVALVPGEAGELHYKSSDDNVVYVDPSGFLTAYGVGTAQITVSFPGNDMYEASEGVFSVTVNRHETSIDVVDKLDVKVGDMLNLNATLSPSEAGKLDYASSNESVVIVNRSGEVTAVGAGSTIITVSFKGDYYYADASKDIIVTVSKVDTSIDVADKVEMTVGDVVNLNATLTPGGAGELNYSSSDESVVCVNEIGELTAMSGGSAIVTVRFAGNDKYAAAESKNILVTVGKLPAVIDVVSKLEMKVDEVIRLNASLTPEGAGELVYVSSDESVVTVNSLGEVTGITGGAAIVTVKFTGNDEYSAAESKNVLVTVALADASVSAENISMTVDENVTIAATTTPEGLNITYTADDSGVVKVENGVVTGLKEGTAKINLTVGGDNRYLLNSTTITVTVSKINTSISVADKLDLIVDGVADLNASLTPAEAGELEYVSSDVSVVSVNSNGVVTAVGNGTANITVRFAGNYKYAAAESKNVTVTVSKVNTSISVVDKLDLIVDDEVNLNATLTPAEAGELEYLSSDVSVVSVNSLGEVTAVGNGTANITVRFIGNYKYAAAECKNVTVTVRIATNITVEGDNIEINVGNSTKIEASLTPAEAGELDYTSSDVSVVTVNGIGEITAVGEGRANITVRFIQNGLYAASSINITVTIALNNASVSAEDISMIIGDNATINVTTSPEGLNVTYTVDDSGVVSLENGVLTALREGTAKINLTVGGDGKYVLNSTEITVTVSKVETFVSIESDNIEINVGDSAEIKASLTPSEAGELEYTSSDVKVATVDSLGKVTAVGAGTANITVKFAGNEKYASSCKNITVSVGRIASKFADVVVVANKVTLVLSDAFGNPISGANISYTINGISASAVSDANGSFEIISQGGAVIVVEYLGSDIYAPSNITITMTPQRLSTVIVGEDFTQYACDYYVGERGNNFTVQLRDANGRPIADKTVYIGYNGVTLIRTTDANGYANVQINLKNSGLYTFVVVFMDDEEYDASMKVFKVTINKKPTSISAGAKTFKASAKTKKYTVTLKTIPGSSADGKTYLASGKKVSLKINGKTYTAKTNAKGQATFSLKITKRGIFNAVVSYAGDNTYNPSSSKVKITIK
ncbi:Ig-like domain-containing protein [uncultured Methanobrevibacter sp.]|uniref:Ig-like domain-containing protein n=1 Tax=uncultured Methanobrevibacter sp. TaxID=253161 RepID=UPI0025EFD998|nr:Ig-like domain-containing protein [uncultured Methanobrevibacter sp.]